MLIPPPIPGGPVLSYRVLARAISVARLNAYSLPDDADSIDAIARYVWNLHIGAAFAPALHFLEVTFRNTIYLTGERTSTKRFGTLTYNRVQDCWLDSSVIGQKGLRSILEPRERSDVDEALVRLGQSKARHTAGHLVGQLGFGFWIRLCDSPYDQGNRNGPAIWPDAAKGFPNCTEPGNKNRGGIRAAFDAMREFRNLIAHHKPVWDLNPKQKHDRVVQLIGWMNKQVAAAVQQTSTLHQIVDAGPGAYRPLAQSVMAIAI